MTFIDSNDFVLKSGLAQMLKGGVIMDVMDVEQSRIAEAAGAVAVMALEAIPSRIRARGGVSRMSDPQMIADIRDAATIPVMAKVRIGHFVEAQVLESLDIDFIDESEVLTPADEQLHIDKTPFKIPFVCGAITLGQAMRRIDEGAAMIRTKGEAGTGNIVEAVRHWRLITSEIDALQHMGESDLKAFAEREKCTLSVLQKTAELGRLPVVTFAAGGIATPADAALMMQMGVDGVFVGSGIFDAEKPAVMADAIVKATLNYADASIIADVSRGLGQAMKSQDMGDIAVKYAARGY